MKKLYTTTAVNDLSYSRFSSSLSGVVGVSLVAVAAFLSNVSPVFSANIGLTKASLESMKNAAVLYPQSTFSAYNDYNSGMGVYNSVINVLTADGRSAWEDAQNIFRVRGTVVSDARRNKRAKNAVILDPEKYTVKEKSFVIDSMDRALRLGSIAISSGYDNQDGIEGYTFANGYSSRANADGRRAIAIGTNAETKKYGHVILGDGSGTNSASGVSGYDPFTQKESTKTDEVWKSTASTATIGNYKTKVTRQLEGVAAGTYDSDAVNVAQLKSLKKYVDQGWMLSVGGKNSTTVGITSVVDFSVTSDNLKVTITKGEKDSNVNNVKFALNDNLKLTNVTTGQSTMNDDGFVIKDGPRMTVDGFFINDNGPSITVDGIEVGDKTIKGVAAGEQDTDAVNYKQLTEVKTLAENGWKLSVDGNNATDVKAGSTVNFVAVKQKDDDNNGSENTNIKITKGDNNEVKFDLSEYIKVGRVETGLSSMSNAGFMIKGGPNMTKGGIFAANTKITGVQKGTNENDAVNVSQLNEIKDQIADNSLVKWDGGEKLITIGAQKGGTKLISQVLRESEPLRV